MIVTPRGLKIYLPRDYGFALMARLFPDVDAFRILETTQGINKIHGAAAFVTGIVCFLLRLPALQIAVWTSATTFLFFLLRLFGFFIVPGMISGAVIYSRFTGYMLITAIVVVAGLICVGPIGTGAYFASRLVIEGVTVLIDMIAGAKLGRVMGIDPLLAKGASLYFAPAADFIRACRFHAAKLGCPMDKDVSEQELDRENWIHVWEDLASKWPQVVSRFSAE